MRKSLLVPALALGVALSGSAFGQSWTRSTTTNPQSPDNTYNANTYDQQKARAQGRQNNAMTAPPNSAQSPSNSAKMTAQPNSGQSSSLNSVERSGGPHGD